MTTLTPKALWLGLPLVVGLFGAMLTLLYTLLLGGPWTAFLWSGGLSFALILGIKLVSVVRLDDKRQLLVSAMLWELLGGVFGWIWMILALASVVLFVQGLFFGGSFWWRFFVALVVAGACRRLYGHSSGARQAVAFKELLIEQGLTKAQARKVWIAEASRRLREAGQTSRER